MKIPWSQIRHFSQAEFGGGKHDKQLNPGLVIRLDVARHIVGRPFDVHVAFARSGHSKGSAHYKGMAVDGHFSAAPDTDALSAFEAEYDALRAAGFVGIGFYPGWGPRPGWHADVMDRKGDGSLTEWVRGQDGVYRYGKGVVRQALIQHYG